MMNDAFPKCVTSFYAWCERAGKWARGAEDQQSPQLRPADPHPFRRLGLLPRLEGTARQPPHRQKAPQGEGEAACTNAAACLRKKGATRQMAEVPYTPSPRKYQVVGPSWYTQNGKAFVSQLVGMKSPCARRCPYPNQFVFPRRQFGSARAG